MRVRMYVLYPTLLMSIALVVSACSPAATPAPTEPPTEEPAAELSGDIAIDGSSTVFPITEAVAEEFRAVHPQVHVTVGISGTGGGFEKFCNGELDIVDASRAIRDTEKEACAAAGIEYEEFLVGLDGLSVVVNPANDYVSCLTTEQLKAIWDAGSTVDNWNQVDPSFPDEPLTLYGAGTDSGTFDFFSEVINGEAKRSRSDYTASEDDNVLVQGIRGDPNGLAYFGMAYFLANQDQLKAVEIDGGEGCVAPSFETVNSAEYAPLSRPLYIYARKDSLERPEVVAFADFYLTEAPGLVNEVGYVAVPQEQYDEALARLEAYRN